MPLPDLTVDKTGPATAAYGVPYSYTITVTNNGGAATTAAATVTDVISDDLGINSVSPGCVVSAPPAPFVVTCTVPAGLSNVAPSNVATFTINVTPYALGDIANTASVEGGGDPACPTGTPCTSPPVTTNVTGSILGIAKSGPATGTVGVAYDYTLTVTNSGTAATNTAATVEDDILAGLTINSVSPGCTVSLQTVTCTVPAGLSNVAPTNTASFTINVTPTAAVANSTVPNSATVNGAGDSRCSWNESPPPWCVSNEVETDIPGPDLRVDKTGPANAVVGVAYDYVLTVTNNGVDATAAAMVTDTLDANLAINSAGPGCTVTLQDVSCTIAALDLEAGESVVITINVTPQASAAESMLHNAASLTGGGDPNCTPSCDSDDVPTWVDAAPTQTVVKSAATLTTDADSSGTITEGDTLTYTVTVTNTGDMPLTNVTVNDTQLSPNTFNCASVAVGGTCVLTGTHVVTAAEAQAGQVVNTGNTTSTEIPGPTDSNTVTTPVLVPSISVAKSADPISGTAVTAGQTITYTVTVVVTSAPLSSPLVLTDTLGTGLTFVAFQAGTSAEFDTSGGLGNVILPTGTGSYTLVYTATVDAGATGAVGNNVTVSGGGDPDPVCTTCTTNNPVSPQVSASKSANPASGTAVAPGDTITYTVTVAVANGPLTANAVLADTLGTGLTFVAFQAGTSAEFDTSGGLGNVILPSGTGTGSYTLVYTATVDAGATGAVGNSVTVSGGGDPDPSCTTCTTSHPMEEPATLTIHKTGPAHAIPGQQIMFTILIENTGTVPAENVVVTDPPPTGLTWISNSGDCTTAFPCNLGTLAPGDARVIDVTMSLALNYSGPPEIINTATVTSTSTSSSSSSSAVVTVATSVPFKLVPANAPWALWLLGLLTLLLAGGAMRRHD
ncbi:MAG TPA: hypothetical protein VFN29_02460 [Chiayiivirga sp.]|nr:hypothetical protein [Chiayiivirga sp.]